MWLYKWTFPSQITPIKLSTMRPRKISCTWEEGHNKSYTSTFHLGIMNSRNNDLKRDCTGVWPQNIRSRRRNLPPRRRESYPVHTRKTINDSMLRAYFRLCRKLQWWRWNKPPVGGSISASRVLKLWRLQMIIIWQRYFKVWYIVGSRVSNRWSKIDKILTNHKI